MITGVFFLPVVRTPYRAYRNKVNGTKHLKRRFSSCTILSIMNTQPRATNGCHIIIRGRLIISPDRIHTIRGRLIIILDHIHTIRGRISRSILGINV
ncbi:Secreted protein [Bacillus velezensis]|nr:protein of unknown function [Bacillus velezensis UCMB5033]